MIVHLIVNSHLDPVWLWRREQGIDEVLSTGRTACDLLDRYPELVITRGESWFYEIIEKYAPALFARIRAYVASGRWHIVGGWYIQPDCNLASPETYLAHGRIACGYFRKKFGVSVQTGYNVDSFGHNAMLPSFYAASGIRNYVFMRPMEHEMTLPANDFIWRAPDGKEVLTSRIIGGYGTWKDCHKDSLEYVLKNADSEIGHVMCFWGVGDHGGGPLREELDWVLEHRNDYPGVEIRFSHPDAYFEAVRASGAELPVMEGELQHHAIGCYAAYSRIKREVRETENALIRLDRLLPSAQREAAWKKLLFATFHDIFAGTCIRSGYDDVFDSLGAARESVREAFLKKSRRRNFKLPPKSRQRIIFDNTDAAPFHGFVTFQPSLIERWKSDQPVAFYGAGGRPYPAQMIASPESSVGWKSFVFPMDIPGRGRRILELDYAKSNARSGSVKAAGAGRIGNETVAVELNRTGIASLKRGETEFLAAPPEAVVIPDATDTWSHGINSFADPPSDRFRLKGAWKSTIRGSWLSETAVRSADRDGNSLTWFCRVFDGIPGIQLKLNLNWHSAQKMVKLLIRPAFKVAGRMDGIPGGVLERSLNGEEYPVFNRMTLSGGKHALSIVSRDVFSADVQPDGTVRLTLLRSPYFAHHDPWKTAEFAGNGVTEQGEHEFTVTLLADPSEQEICDEILRQSNPVFCSETTFGLIR